LNLNRHYTIQSYLLIENKLEVPVKRLLCIVLRYFQVTQVRDGLYVLPCYANLPHDSSQLRFAR